MKCTIAINFKFMGLEKGAWLSKCGRINITCIYINSSPNYIDIHLKKISIVSTTSIINIYFKSIGESKYHQGPIKTPKQGSKGSTS